MIESLATNVYIFYTVAFLSSIASTALGIGSGILIPLAALFYGPKESIGIMTLYFCVQNINKIILFKKYIHWKIVKKVVIWAIPGAIGGSLLLTYIPEDFFKKFLAIAMIIYIVNDIIRRKYKKTETEHEKNIPILGLSYGFFSGLLGSGNIIKGQLFTSLGLIKETYLGTYSITSFFLNIPKVAVYTFSNIINTSVLIQALPFIGISIIGTQIGKNFLKKINNDFFYIAINISFIVSALLLLAQ